MALNSIILIALISFIVILIIGAIFVIRRNGSIRHDLTGGYINEQIYVGNLPYRVDENDLKGFFSQFGNVQTIKIIRNFKTGQSKGYAFVSYSNAKQATKALSAHGQDLYGRSLVVRIAKPRQEYAFS